jgi:hypothetical protein
LERAMGIEPTSEAWEASILPLYDARSVAIVPANWLVAKRWECGNAVSSELLNDRDSRYWVDDLSQGWSL